MTTVDPSTPDLAHTAVVPDPAQLRALFRARRSSLVCDKQRPVERELIDTLLAAIGTAPNHRRTNPWRVAVFTGEGRAALGDALAADRIAASPVVLDPAVVDKTRTKYTRTPAVVLVGCAAHDDPTRHREDLLACAAGIEHLLLAATAAGLASLWSSPPVLTGSRTSRVAGLDPSTSFVGIVYLGHRRPDAETLPAREPVELDVRYIDA